MIHMMGLAEADFEKVKAGTKTLELRLFSKRKASIEIGDSICFESQGNGSQKIICEVRSIHRGEHFTIYSVRNSILSMLDLSQQPKPLRLFEDFIMKKMKR